MDPAEQVPFVAAGRTRAGARRVTARVVHWLGAPFGPHQSRFMCRSLGVGFLGGALVGCLSLAFPGAPDSIFGIELATGGLAVLTGIVLLAGVLENAPPASFALVVTWGVLLASLAALGGGSPVSGGELFFFWVVPYAFAFFSLRLAWLLTSLMAVASAAVLLLEHHLDPAAIAPGVLLGLWFLLTSAEIAVGVVVRRLGRSLRDVDLRFWQAFAHSPVGAAFLTLSGTVVEVNDALCTMAGRTRRELVGATLTELVHPADHGALSSGPLGQLVATGELRLLRPDGRIVWASCSATTIVPEVGPAYRFSQYQDITQHRRDREALSRRATHDPLTGLFNRTLLLERLEAALLAGEALNGGRPAVILLDLDQFKLVNDSLGHQVGDDLLVGLAPRLASAVLPGDTLARLGGDEFVVLCQGVTGRAQALARAERLAAAFRQPLALVGRRYVVSASIGVAVATGYDDTAPGLLRDADAAMYRAKANGRNRIEIFDESMREEARMRLELERALRSAVQRQELSLVYQPIVDLESGRPISLEALVRWNHPERGVIEPGSFIHLAEETGAIVELGSWVLDQALSDLVELQAQLRVDPPLRINVNVSARQLLSGDFAGFVRDRLARCPITPRSLGVEITESVLIPDTVPISVLHELRALDCVVLLDDFGTGYSSLAYLDQFPIDVLKIDRSFTSRLFDGRGHAAVIEAILTMARALSVRVVAEGVETTAQLARLRELGCAEVQGNIITPPLGFAEVTRFCREMDTVARALEQPEQG
jgi:diguanylate cyclase (GGDEF)-like protein/PAS domain S-box-containing protein